ncbi:hypothetical protein MMC26_003851 [Xylographa opegraphella]|nr:hypothetical protein [Xylographa opegraphella]
MGIAKKNHAGQSGRSERKAARDRQGRLDKPVAMHRGINQQLKGARVHNNNLATKLAQEGKISKATAKGIRARYTKDKQQARNDAATRGGLALDDEGPWRFLTEPEMVEEDRKLTAEAAAATETLALWTDMFGEGAGPSTMVEGEETGDAAGPDVMEEEADEEEEEEAEDDKYDEEEDQTAPGAVSPFTITNLPIRSRPPQ